MPIEHKGELCKDGSLAFCGDHNLPTFFRNLQKRKLTCRERDVTHYGSRSCFPTYTSTTPIVMAPPPVTGRHYQLNHGNNPYLNPDHKKIKKTKQKQRQVKIDYVSIVILANMLYLHVTITIRAALVVIVW